MRASHVIRLLTIGVMFLFAAADQGLSAQTPDVIETGGLLPVVSIKTAPEFNRKVAKQLEKPHSIEKGEYPIRKLVEEMEKQSGVKIELQSFRALDDTTNFSEAKIKFNHKLVGISGRTVLRLICGQIPATYWVADDRVFLVPTGRVLNKLIEETILAQQPVPPRLLEGYFEEIRESRRAKDRSARMVEALAAPVDVEPMQKPLSAALELVRKKYAINIVFAPALEGKQPNGRPANGRSVVHAAPLDTLITLPELKGVRLDRLLQLVLNQASDLAFDVHSDHILIRKSRDSDSDTIVHVAFNDISLAKAVDELVEQTGKAIVVNLPEGDRRKLVSMTVLNEPLATAVDLLALQVGAEVKRVNRAYVLVKTDLSKGSPAK